MRAAKHYLAKVIRFLSCFIHQEHANLIDWTANRYGITGDLSVYVVETLQSDRALCGAEAVDQDATFAKMFLKQLEVVLNHFFATQHDQPQFGKCLPRA